MNNVLAFELADDLPIGGVKSSYRSVYIVLDHVSSFLPVDDNETETYVIMNARHTYHIKTHTEHFHTIMENHYRSKRGK